MVYLPIFLSFTGIFIIDNCLQMNIMSDGFNIKKGILNVLKELAHSPEFVTAVINLILGQKEAADELKYMLKNESYNQTINEAVAIHRLLKNKLNEDTEPNNKKDKNLLRKIAEIQKKSIKFRIKVLLKALKKPGVIPALIKLIASEGADPSAWAVLAPAIVDSAIEVMDEDEEMQVSLAEEITTNENSVNIMVGRFQPFTLGHLKCLKGIKNALGVPTLLCVIPGNGDDKHPFMGDVQDEMYERLKEANPDLIADVAYVKNAFIETWVIAAKERGLEPVSWTCGNDRIGAYRSMVEKHGQKYGLSPEFQVYLVDRGDDNISATSVRESLLSGNKAKFMAEMPECLHDMYDEMRRVITGSEKPAYQTSGSMMEDKEYFAYRKRLDEAITKLVKDVKM